MVDIKRAIKDLATLAIGVLVVDVVFEVTGLALSSLNSATANLTSYVSVATLASVINTLVPIERFAEKRFGWNGRGVHHSCHSDTARVVRCGQPYEPVLILG